MPSAASSMPWALKNCFPSWAVPWEGCRFCSGLRLIRTGSGRPAACAEPARPAGAARVSHPVRAFEVPLPTPSSLRGGGVVALRAAGLGIYQYRIKDQDSKARYVFEAGEILVLEPVGKRRILK